jgi:hypothetical protein
MTARPEGWQRKLIFNEGLLKRVSIGCHLVLEQGRAGHDSATVLFRRFKAEGRAYPALQ